MRELVAEMRGKLGSGVVALGAASRTRSRHRGCDQGPDRQGSLRGKGCGRLATMVGGKGGGRPDPPRRAGAMRVLSMARWAKAAEVVGGLI